ncbi:hypothetical protein D3C79_1118600 [compost metagenome]
MLASAAQSAAKALGEKVRGGKTARISAPPETGDGACPQGLGVGYCLPAARRHRRYESP